MLQNLVTCLAVYDLALAKCTTNVNAVYIGISLGFRTALEKLACIAYRLKTLMSLTGWILTARHTTKQMKQTEITWEASTEKRESGKEAEGDSSWQIFPSLETLKPIRCKETSTRREKG